MQDREPSRLDKQTSKLQESSRMKDREPSRVDKQTSKLQESSRINNPYKVESSDSDMSKIMEEDLDFSSDEDISDEDNSDENNSDENNSDENNSDEDNSDENNSDEDNSDEDNSDEEILKKNILSPSPPKKNYAPRITNSPSSRKKLIDKSNKDKRGDNYEYKTRYRNDKINYYKTLGKYHVEEVDDSSTEYSESSDDFPSPSPIRYRNEKDRHRDRNERERRDKERRDRDKERKDKRR